TLEIHYDGASQARMQSWLGHSFLYKHQRKESLGDRMTEAMRPHLQYSSGVLLIGSDCPDINTAILQEALLSLTSHKVVLGPTHDGGYYLIGVSGHLPAWQLQHLFEDIPWGTETVFKRTLDTIKRHHLNYHLVKKLHDIDTPEDLRYIDYHPDTQ
ncbi:MAG: glycosyltransferase, partial [Deltaproteobacteria bacterium]|nr:glycosyltransferase [Deltaproteobacteria bacterium]